MVRETWRWLIPAAASLLVLGSNLGSSLAWAFFPPIIPDPGSAVSLPPPPQPPLPPVVIPPPPPPPFIPPLPPVIIPPDPPQIPTDLIPPVPPPVTPQVPEPGTLISGLAGLAVIAASRMRRRWRHTT
jgi:hypothetical protein